ncbi:uncharacterized protein [Elaeis guineensis]|uniref:uncharacterized protein isoform X2 n=1 Tax=Elaeis guineensis var. tenera TaxID=51953 RepID=UPI003C6CF89B
MHGDGRRLLQFRSHFQQLHLSLYGGTVSDAAEWVGEELSSRHRRHGFASEGRMDGSFWVHGSASWIHARMAFQWSMFHFLDWHFMVQGSKKIFNIFLKYLAFSKRSATTHACCSLTKLIVHKILLRFSLLVFSTHLNSDEIGIPRMGWQARRCLEKGQDIGGEAELHLNIWMVRV